ncbi:MAG: thiamine-phosphate kinase [Myxococcales bacterium]|nr:thiamine-phosphate kinase [Myxococcales bacterium]
MLRTKTLSSDDQSTLRTFGEDEVIRIFSSLGHPVGREVIVPNGDDAAVVQLDPDQLSVMTTDTLVEDVHFSWTYTSAEEVGRKLVAVNISDIAAMGALPRYILLSFVFPPSTSVGKLKTLAAGIHAQCVQCGTSVIGGNVSHGGGPMVLTATLWGVVNPGHILRRSGARPGDIIYITGWLGNARAALCCILSGKNKVPEFTKLRESLVSPVPRVTVGHALANTGVVSSMCDVSDGLGRDLRYLLASSDLGAEIWRSHLPLSADLLKYCQSAGVDAPTLAAEGGEDYELLFTAPQDAAEMLQAVGECNQTPIHQIGRVMDHGEFYLMATEGQSQPLPGGYTHF